MLSHSYVNASYTVPYHGSLSSIQRDSGLLDASEYTAEKAKVLASSAPSG